MVRGLKFHIKEVEILHFLYVGKTKTQLSCLVTGQLICTFFVYAKGRFSHDLAHMVMHCYKEQILDMNVPQ